MTVYGYLRVSTEEQARTGYGLEAQRSAIAKEALSRGWDIVWVADDGVSASIPPGERPALGALLDTMQAGDVLLCSKRDRVARSSLDFAQLMATAAEAGWSLILLDLGVDMTTPVGRFISSIMAAVAELERELIRSRTKDALAAAKSRGVRLGRKPSLPADVRTRIRHMRDAGQSFQSIADQLNAQHTPTAQGGKQWHRGTVRGVLAVNELQEVA